jgi:hypothetical protein
MLWALALVLPDTESAIRQHSRVRMVSCTEDAWLDQHLTLALGVCGQDSDKIRALECVSVVGASGPLVFSSYNHIGAGNEMYTQSLSVCPASGEFVIGRCQKCVCPVVAHGQRWRKTLVGLAIPLMVGTEFCKAMQQRRILDGWKRNWATQMQVREDLELV